MPTRSLRFAPLLTIALTTMACSSADNGTESGGAAPSSGNATAFAFPALATAPFTAASYDRFAEPFSLAFLPEGGALITEKAGKLKFWRDGADVIDVAGVPAVEAGGQGGFLDVAPAPDYATSKRIYFSYSEPSPRGSQLALASATLAISLSSCPAEPCAGTARLDGVQVIWRSGSAGEGGQFGAIIAFAPDGQSLFLASGERQRFTPAQDPDQAIGKIIHLTLDGKPSPDNPLPGRTGAASVMVADPPRDTLAAAANRGRAQPVDGPNLAPAETWSSGHRNPYGLAFDSAGNLWEHEMGPKGGDEVNVIVRGKNYGWPVVSNGDNYNGKPIPDHTNQPQFEPPKLFWNPSISPAGLILYSGEMFPAWRNSGLMGAMSGEALIRFSTSGTGAAKADQWDMGTRIRDVAQAPDGSVWLLEDGDEGRLIRLTPKS